MTIVITLGLHTGCIGGIFVRGIFGNFYTKWGEFLTFRTRIPGGLDRHENLFSPFYEFKSLKLLDYRYYS